MFAKYVRLLDLCWLGLARRKASRDLQHHEVDCISLTHGRTLVAIPSYLTINASGGVTTLLLGISAAAVVVVQLLESASDVHLSLPHSQHFLHTKDSR